MLKIPDTVEVYISLQPTDMRRSFDSLAGSVKEIIGKDPLSGHLFVFIDKRGGKIKILFWDRTGYCLYYKRLEAGRVSLPVGTDTSMVLTHEQLRLILDGIDLWGIKAG